MSLKPFVYIIVCSDLTPRQIVVQSCHAALESGIHEKHPNDVEAGLIILQVSDEKSLLCAHKKLKSDGINSYLFYEEPLNRYTALATEAISQEDRVKLKKFKLLSMPGTTWWDDTKRITKRVRRYFETRN